MQYHDSFFQSGRKSLKFLLQIHKFDASEKDPQCACCLMCFFMSIVIFVKVMDMMIHKVLKIIVFNYAIKLTSQDTSRSQKLCWILNFDLKEFKQ